MCCNGVLKTESTRAQAQNLHYSIGIAELGIGEHNTQFGDFKAVGSPPIANPNY
jgi:hypothetical protein